MLDEAVLLPDDSRDLKALARLLIAEVKAQAVLIEKLRHQLAGHQAHRFGPSSESAEQLQLALETSEVVAAAIMGQLHLPEEGPEEQSRPRRRPLPDHIPGMHVEILPGEDACARCGGHLRRLGEDVTEELEYVPGRFVVNRIVRPRLACSGCERFVQAPLPRGPSSVAGLVLACSPTSWWRSTATTSRFCDRAGLVKHPSSRSLLLSVVGTPPQDADYGGAGGS